MLRSEHGYVDGLLDSTTMGSFRVHSTDPTTEKHHDPFQVNDMTCGHCVSMITKAVKAGRYRNPRFDLAAHRVDIEAGQADAADLSKAIKPSGYAPCRSTMRMPPMVPAPHLRAGLLLQLARHECRRVDAEHASEGARNLGRVKFSGEYIVGVALALFVCGAASPLGNGS